MHSCCDDGFGFHCGSKISGIATATTTLDSRLNAAVLSVLLKTMVVTSENKKQRAPIAWHTASVLPVKQADDFVSLMKKSAKKRWLWERGEDPLVENAPRMCEVARNSAPWAKAESEQTCWVCKSLVQSMSLLLADLTSTWVGSRKS